MLVVGPEKKKYRVIGDRHKKSYLILELFET